MRAGSPIGDAILKLCARPQGFRNDTTDRALLMHLGLGIPSNQIGSRIQKFKARGWVVSDAVAVRGRSTAYRITEKGLAFLARRRGVAPTMRPRKPAAAPIQLADWRRAPLVGDPHRQAAPKPERIVSLGIAAGLDPRYQIDPATFKGGDLVAEWKRLRGIV